MTEAYNYLCAYAPTSKQRVRLNKEGVIQIIISDIHNVEDNDLRKINEGISDYFEMKVLKKCYLQTYNYGLKYHLFWISQSRDKLTFQYYYMKEM